MAKLSVILRTIPRMMTRAIEPVKPRRQGPSVTVVQLDSVLQAATMVQGKLHHKSHNEHPSLLSLELRRCMTKKEWNKEGMEGSGRQLFGDDARAIEALFGGVKLYIRMEGTLRSPTPWR